jgi:hypothetical protein
LVGQPLVESCAEVILPGIDDQRCEAMLVASRARRQVATKATAEEDEAIGVRMGPAPAIWSTTGGSTISQSGRMTMRCS